MNSQLIQSYKLDCDILAAATRCAAELRWCDASEARGFYVYALLDPANGEIFYIGKGRGLRYLQHGKEGLKNSRKWARIQCIRATSADYGAIYLADGLTSSQALMVERQIIRLIGIKRLTNIMRGSSDEPLRAIIQAASLIAALSRSRDGPWKHKLMGDAGVALRMALEQAGNVATP